MLPLDGIRDDTLSRGLEPSRRQVLASVGTAGVGLAGLSRATSAESAAAPEYVLIQGGTCTPVTPFSGNQPVKAFYDLRIPDRYDGDNGATDPGSPPYFRSVGTADLQRPRTSLTFLYRGPDGLSLVVVHGIGDGRVGGSASWTVAGLPGNGSWVVKDDYYLNPETGAPDGTNYDRWNVDGPRHVIDWTWGDGATDGGAFNPLPRGFRVVILPRFNERARLWNQYYEGRIDTWTFLSGDRERPDRHSLDLDEPVVLTVGHCAGDGTGRDEEQGNDEGEDRGRKRGDDEGDDRGRGRGNDEKDDRGRKRDRGRKGSDDEEDDRGRGRGNDERDGRGRGRDGDDKEDDDDDEDDDEDD